MFIRTSSARRQSGKTACTEDWAASGRLIAAVAHELKNPIQALGNALFLLEKCLRGDALPNRYLKAAQEELGRMKEITASILSSYRESPPRRAINIPAVLDSILEFYDHKIRFKRIQICRRYSSVSPVETSAGEIQQVFTNLVINALEAVPKGGKVVVHAFSSRDWSSPERDGIRVVIGDNGPGIHPEHRRRLFEPFFTTKTSRGTGLGLWLSQVFMERLGSRVRLRTSTRPHRAGTCFSVFLPFDRSTLIQAR